MTLKKTQYISHLYCFIDTINKDVRFTKTKVHRKMYKKFKTYNFEKADTKNLQIQKHKIEYKNL